MRSRWIVAVRNDGLAFMVVVGIAVWLWLGVVVWTEVDEGVLVKLAVIGWFTVVIGGLVVAGLRIGVFADDLGVVVRGVVTGRRIAWDDVEGVELASARAGSSVADLLVGIDVRLVVKTRSGDQIRTAFWARRRGRYRAALEHQVYALNDLKRSRTTGQVDGASDGSDQGALAASPSRGTVSFLRCPGCGSSINSELVRCPVCGTGSGD